MAQAERPHFCSLCGSVLKTWARPTFSSDTGVSKDDKVFYAICPKGHERWQADDGDRWHRFEMEPPNTTYEVIVDR